tara:strand:+ start:562 stop:852 length:291 start_codon:yes stop_codon:yes gene_type:complete
MKVKKLMKKLVKMDPDTDIKINLMGGSMPDYLDYFAELDYIDYNQNTKGYEICISASAIKNENTGTLLDLLRQCEPTGDGVTEFPGRLKHYDSKRS